MQFKMFCCKSVILQLIIITGLYGKSISNDNSWVPRLTKKDLNGFSLISRIPLTRLFKFNFYRDVSILFYPMPEDVSEAKFLFKAVEEKMNYLGGKCVPQDIDIHLKSRGFPVVSPTNVSFPEDFVENSGRNKIISLKIKSDESNNSIVLKNPIPGDWFGIAFVSWSDPLSDKIEQQGIAAVCDTVLYTDMRITKANVSVIACDENVDIHLKNTSLPAMDVYKCYIKDYDNSDYLLSFSVISRCDSCHWAVLKIQGRSLPDDDDNLARCAINLNNPNKNISVKFSPYSNEWHYIEISYGNNDEFKNLASNLTLCSISEIGGEIKKVLSNEFSNSSLFDLVRDTKSEYFTFEYNLSPNSNEHTPTLLNLTSGNLTYMKFNIFPVQDIGGTLSLGATLKMDLKYYMGYKREKTNTSEYYFTDKDPFYKVIVCVGLDKALIPYVNETCQVNNKWQPATVVINSTDSDSVSNIVHIPYPEIGVWYVTLALFCDKESVCPCRTELEKNNTKYLVKAGGDTYSGKDVRIGSDHCNASVVFSISSAPCLGGKCGLNGACNFYMSGGFIYSSCRCKGGYAGWDCSDVSHVTSAREILTSVLFLTLSNLLFIPSIYFAIRRQYYTEALVYFFTMFFSTFYHACDVGDSNYSMCIVRMGVLQYCDFFCGLLSFWVTLVAMASLDTKIVSLLHMFGAIIIAFGTEMDKQALLVFLIPVLAGICIVITAWMFKCRQTRKMFPARAYLVLYLPAGVILATIGLICYAFLQTNANYHVVHSVWHMIIALSVLCLLPNRVYFIPKS